MNENKPLTRGQWFVLVGAFLGWMFDGVEMGLFPIVARPALQDLLQITDDGAVAYWNSIIVASFLLGAAIGGVTFGWLGDRFGRVRAMAASILIYSLFAGACYFAAAPWQLGLFLFAAALGMGGQWSLAVALVMECWPERHRSKLAGAISCASSVGFLLIVLVALTRQVTSDDWRWMMLVGAAPAVLALFIFFALPESERWKEASQKRQRSPLTEIFCPGFLKNTLLAIILAAVPLIGTWAAIAGWTPLWVDQMAQEQAGIKFLPSVALEHFQEAETPRERQAILATTLGREHWHIIRRQTAYAKVHVLVIYAICSAAGGFLAPVIIGSRGRRPAYFLLCTLALTFGGALYLFSENYNGWFMFLFGVLSAVAGSFYGWLALYLPELFPTRIRATGQGVSFNAGRAVAAGGSVFMGQFVALFNNHYGHAAAAMCSVYAIGAVLIWFAPETSGHPLPE
jgi:MFS transporter, SHS family, sialic acid transporter